MIDKDRFRNFYQNDIQRKIKELNSLRQEVSLKASIAIVIGILIPLPFLYALFTSEFIENYTIVSAFLLLIIIFCFIGFPMFGYDRMTYDYRNKYKTEIVTKALAGLSDNCEHNPDIGLPRAFFNSTLLFVHYPAPNSYISEDLFALEKDANSVIFSEVRASCGNKDTKRTIFTGLLGFIPVGKEYMSPIVIRSKDFSETSAIKELFSPLFEKRAHKSGKYGGMHQIDFKDHKFNFDFRVYALDPEKTKELLNPQIRAGILELKKELNADLHFSFINGLLYIAIPSKRNLFDPPVFSDIQEELVHKDFKLIEAMFNLIELLNINVKEEEKMSAKELMQIVTNFEEN